MNYNSRKSDQLGDNFQKLSNRLKKNILFSLVQKCGLDICHRCKKKIESATDLSIDHIQAWMYATNARELFDDVNNIAFSHKLCNSKSKRQQISRFGRSGFKGVRKLYGRYQASISIDGRMKYIGTFDTDIEAAKAWDVECAKLHGDKAVTNESLNLYAKSNQNNDGEKENQPSVLAP